MCADAGVYREELPVAQQSAETLTTFYEYRSNFLAWNLAFEKFMISESKSLTNREVQAAALLKILHTTSKIIAQVRSDANDEQASTRPINAESYLRHLDDFHTIIKLCSSLILAEEQDARNGKPLRILSADLGMIAPLFYVCIRCPIESVQNTAMELLSRCQRREGMWDPVIVVNMVRHFRKMREKYRQSQTLSSEVRGAHIARMNPYFSYFNRPKELDDTFGINDTFSSSTWSFLDQGVLDVFDLR